MGNYIQLKNQIQKLQKEAEILRKRERNETVAKIKLSGTKFSRRARKVGKKSKSGGTAAAKRPGRPAKSAPAPKEGRKSAANDKRSIVAPKYRDSATGTTWTGRGKQPKWLAAAIKGGKKLEDFKI